jgi:DNA-binding NarL/FixJ family response regulator
MQILIVAKADSYRRGFHTLLDGLVRGLAIDELEDPAQIVACMQNHAYDLVFLYPNQPWGKVLACARTIKEVSPQTYQITITEDQGQTEQALQAGASDVLLKGFSASELVYAMLCHP